MTFSRLWSNVAIPVVVAVLFALSVSAHADTYQIFNLGVANSNSVYGIDAAGDVVIRGSSFCGVFGYCYKTYTDGVLSSVSATAPSLDYDNGTACKPVVEAGKGACNNGREAFGANFDSMHGLFTGPDPAADFLFGGSVDAIVMNSFGDIAWTDGRDEYNWVAMDLTSHAVPEPNTLMLFATGVLGAAGALRRRLVA